MPGYLTQTQTLSALGAGAPVPINVWFNQFITIASVLPPSILVSVNGTMTFNIEVTGDDVTVPGYVPANGVWVPFTNMSGLTATTASTIGAAVRAVRANITAYTSGTLTWQLVQMIGTGG